MRLQKLRQKMNIHANGFLFAVGIALLVGLLALQPPMEASASIDPGLDSGNATVDRSSVPGETILLYRTAGNSTFKAPAGVTSVRVLAIGGGGGGGAGELANAGDGGGGGGAGEYLHDTSFAVTPGQSVNITVGGGGNGSTTKQNDGGTTAQNGASGSNSAFGSLTARGGGGGGGNDQHGVNGGSGGGAGGHCTNSGSNTNGGTSTAVSPGIGNAGGSSSAGSCSPRGAAGGGGAGAIGTNGASGNGGAGAIGLQNDITGTNAFYAAGGGGGGGSSSGSGANGGSSIGGNGGNASGGSGTVGAANTGSGGGGGGSSTSTSGGNGGNGGSGVVIVRFTTQEFPDPGGVTGVKMWYKADGAGNTNGQWNDTSGFGYNLTQGTAANQPALTNNAINFNPAYVFDGTNDAFSMPSHGIGGNEPMSAFFAATSNTAAGGWRYFNEFGDDAPSIGLNNGSPELYARGTSPISYTYNTQAALTPHVYGFISPNANNQARIVGVDDSEQSQNVTSGTYATSNGRAGNSFGNTNGSSGAGWSGPIAEAIYFNKVLTPAERLRVVSYLAIKYGITRAQGTGGAGYSDSAGTTIWNADSTFKNNIAGIGRDDATTLNQKQSRSSHTGNLVTVGHGDIVATNQANTNNFAADKTFLLWGHNGSVTDQTTAVSGTNLMRMGRVWKAVVTNTVGPVKIQVPSNVITRSDAKLLVSSSTTFNSTSQSIDMSVNGANYEATTTLAAGTHYFTFASEAGSDIEFVSKTATNPGGTQISSYTPGQPLEYKLSVRNNGPDNAGTVTVTDTLPDGIVPTANGATGGGWSCTVAGQTVTCMRSALNSGVTAPEVIIEATIASSVSGQKVNTASASVTNDPDTSNNSASLTLDAAPVADLALSKEDMSAPVAGSNFDYRFTVTNTGPSDISSFTITDNLPSDLTYVSASPDICGGSSGQNVSCTGSTLTDGDSTEVTLTVAVDGGYGGGDLINTASVDVPDGTTDPNTANNTSSNNTSVSVSTDLTVSKSHTGDFTAGDNNDFTLNVTNAGPSDAPSGSITVTDTLDEDFAYVSATGTNWTCEHSNGTVTCTYDAVLASAATSSDLTITVLVDPIVKGTTANTATVTSTTPDPDTTNNTATDNITIVAEADLAITKDHIGTSFTAGQQGQYTFSVVNNGPSADTPTYTITDTLPTGLTFVSSTGDATCSATGQDVTCTGGGIGVGDPAQVTTITVDVASNASGDFTNTATVVPDPSVTDPTPDNNSDDDIVNITPNADLSITKDHAGDLMAGENTNYALEVTNNGPSDVPSFTVTDALDPNLTFVSGTGDATCSATGQDVTCTGGILNSGDTANITLTVDVASTATDSATIENTADVAVPNDVNDPDMSNNSATIENTIATSADLAITKTHSGNFDVGGTGDFTLEITNNGPSSSSTVTVTDTLAEGFSYIDATSTNAACSNSGQTVTCTTGPTLGSGESVEITLSVAVDPSATATSLNNTASVSSSTNDPDMSNNSATDTVTLDPAEANLVATKTAQGELTAGRPATYRFEVTNDGGPDNAGSVTISDSLPAYLSYQSFSSVDGEWNCEANGQDVTCTLPVLNVDDTASVDVTVLVAQDAPNPAENDASVSFNGNDPSSENPSTSDPVSYEADLELQVSYDSETYHSGDQVTFTYTVINHGPSMAEDVVLTDTLPDGLTLVDIVASHAPAASSVLAQTVDTLLGVTPVSAAPNTPFDCTNSGQDITCSTDTLYTGTYTIQVTAQIADSFTGDLTNTAAITSTTPDPNMDNNAVSSTIVGVTARPGGIGGIVHDLAETGQNNLAWIISGIVLALAGGAIWWRWRRVTHP